MAFPSDCSRRARCGRHYLAFLGRISPEKRVDRAIEIAGRAGLPLKIAAKVDRADQDYFEERIRPARPAARRDRRRDRRGGEGRVPRRRPRPAVPDRLARAVRAGDDRGHGLRHAGDRLRGRLGARGRRGRRHRLHRATTLPGGGGGGRGCRNCRAPPCAATSRRASPPERMARDYLKLYRRLAGRARSSKRPRLINAMARASSLGLLDPLWTPKCREWCRRPD